MLSILHRITGAALGFGAILVTLWLLAALAGDAAFSQLQTFRSSIIGQLMLFGWLFSFVYHFLNGLRHLKWDAGFGLNMKAVYLSGWIVFWGAILLSLAIWVTI